MPVSLQSEQAIFEAARKLPAGEPRDAYLTQVCVTDPALRDRVQRLLAAHDSSVSFLEPPPGWNAAATIDLPPAEQPGATIGPYKLLHVIGEGGMGVVYAAEQTEPVKRRVAFKLIKPGMDSRQVLARFEAERQALALMDHPNIAKVLDAATTDRGRPYFVMELVKGVPITKYCDENRLGLKERLELIIPVCQAIQHAHQKGIIHRDIKPTNVLVAKHDGRADAEGDRLWRGQSDRPASSPSATMFTALGQVIGTLEYMSPEQAELNQLDIDTRSDIYSLGVLLYELLTGNTPFDKQRFHAVAFDEMLRIIREEDPLKPSAKLSSVEGLPSIAANRSAEPVRLTRKVQGELDWIVMKALDKDRTRRYETADGLALDLQRYLNDEHVQACPPSASYRLRKLMRRHRALLTTGTLVAIALIAGTALSTWQAVRATRAEARAHDKEARALFEETKARAAAEAEISAHRRAEEQAQVVEKQRQLLENNDRVNTMVTNQILTVLRDIPVPAAKRQTLLITALSRFGDLDAAERVEALLVAGNQFIVLGDHAAAFKAFDEALSIDPNHKMSHVYRGDLFFRQQDFEKAASDYTAARVYARRGFARCRLGRFDEALADFRTSYEATPAPTLSLVEKGFRGAFVTQAPFDKRLHVGVSELFDRYVEDQQRSEEARLFSANSLAAIEQYGGAQKHCEAAVTAGTRNFIPYYSLAILALQRRDVAAYRQVCAEMLAKSEALQNNEFASFAAWSATLGPGAFDDYSAIIAIARQTLDKQPTSGHRLQILGALLLARPIRRVTPAPSRIDPR